jgi:hypothetical protein
MVKDKGLFKHKTSTWYQSCFPIHLISFSLFSSSHTMMTTPFSSHILPDINEFHIFTNNIAAQVPLKLTSSNYLSWKIQFETLFIGYDLLRYINGSKPCPPKTLTTNNIVTPNAAYNIWVYQDQLILNALIGSLSPTIISFIARANTHPKPSHDR